MVRGLWSVGVSPSTFAIAEQHLRRVLPPVAIISGLAGAMGALAQFLSTTGVFRIGAFAGYLALVAAGGWWVLSPPRRAHVAAFTVSIFLATCIGSIAWQVQSSGPLLHLGILSVGLFYFLVDRRLLAVAQLYAFCWFVLIAFQTRSDPSLQSNAIITLVTWCGGVALHLGRVRVLTELDDAQQALERESAERQRAQDDALAAQKLESLGVMAGGIAHDFNNLLVGIVGGTDLAFDALEDPERMQLALSTIRESSISAQELCRKMLDFAGGRPVVFAAVDLNVIAQEGIRLASASIPGTVLVETDLEPEPLFVYGDRTQLRQAVVNLVSNAAEALGDEGSRIEVSTHRRTTSSNASAILVVKDDGSGISEDIRSRIFDPFFTTKFTGRGLGLAQVAGAVRSHRGEISLDVHGRETRFELCFPLLESGSSSEPPLSEDDSGWRGSGSVLLVDDDEIVLETTRNMIESLGLAVHTARTGEEAIAVLRQSPGRFSSAIVDKTMPGRDGLSTIKALREIAPNLPILLTSGFSTGSEQAELTSGIPVPFLAKPYRRSEIAAALRGILER